jgi:Secretion system C-terminal sorting domain
MDWDVRIYPNPATPEVSVEVSGFLRVLATNIQGKGLHKQTVNKENNVIDVSRKPSGLLIFSLHNGQKVIIIK